MRYADRDDYERDTIDYLHRSAHALESISRHLYRGTALLERLINLLEKGAGERSVTPE